MAFKKPVTVFVDLDILDDYIKEVKEYHYYYANRHRGENFRTKAMEHLQNLQTIRNSLGWDVLHTLERLTGKPIPSE